MTEIERIEISTDPEDWESSSSKWDEKDAAIQNYRRQGLSLEAIGRQPDVQLSKKRVWERVRERQVHPSTEQLIAFTVEHIDRLDALYMRCETAVALKQRVMIDPSLPEGQQRVVIHDDPRLAFLAANVQRQLLEDQRKVFGAVLHINDEQQERARRDGADDQEFKRAQAKKLARELRTKMAERRRLDALSADNEDQASQVS